MVTTEQHIAEALLELADDMHSREDAAEYMLGVAIGAATSLAGAQFVAALLANWTTPAAVEALCAAKH